MTIDCMVLFAQEQVKNCSIPVVVGRSELKAFAEYLDEIHGGEFAVNEIDNFMKSL